MSRDDIQKLLGGYATGTLTPGEEQALFAAALDDQELFDALAREQSLRDLLRDPAARRNVLTALSGSPAPWWKRGMAWVLRPAPISLATACLAGIVGYGVWQARHATQVQTPTIVADSQKVNPLVAGPPEQAAPAPVPKAERSAAPVEPQRRKVAEPAPAPAAAPAVALDKADSAPVFSPKGNVATGFGGARPTQAPAMETQNAPTQNSQLALNQAEQSQQAPPASLNSQARNADNRDGAAPASPARPATAAPLPLPAQNAFVQEMKSAQPFGAVALADSRWSALRRNPDGKLTPVSADEIHAGDSIVLRVEPTLDGYVTVLRPTPGAATMDVLLPVTKAQTGKSLDTKPFTQSDPGDTEILIQYTQQAYTPAAAPGTTLRSASMAKTKAAVDKPQPQVIHIKFR